MIGSTSAQRQLAQIWYLFFAGIITLALASYAFVRSGLHEASNVSSSISNFLPEIFVAAVVLAAGGVVLIKRVAERSLTEGPADTAKARVQTAMFKLLAVADAPAMIGLVLFLLSAKDWLVAAIVTYAVGASVVYKPDFEGWLKKAGHHSQNKPETG